MTLANFNGVDSFTYTVEDNESATSNVATVTIVVAPINDPPVAAADSVSVIQDQLLIVDVLADNGSGVDYDVDGTLLPSTTALVASVKNEDIVAYDGVEFTMLLDGSDVGLHGEALSAFSIISDNEILMAFGSSANVAGVSQTITTSDVVKFTATQLGETTVGSYELYFLGGNVGLGGSSEKIDGLEQLADGRILISTNGSPSVPGVAGRDEDIFAFTPTTLGEQTAGTWEMYFDASQVELGGEDLDAIAVGPTEESSCRLKLPSRPPPFLETTKTFWLSHRSRLVRSPRVRLTRISFLMAASLGWWIETCGAWTWRRRQAW